MPAFDRKIALNLYNPPAQHTLNSSAVNQGTYEAIQLTHLHPPRTMLQRFSESCFGRTLAHPITKNLAGAVVAIGIEIDYMGRHGRDFLGTYTGNYTTGYAQMAVLVGVGVGFWLVSTGLSATTLPRWKSVPLHILKSAGFAIGGLGYVAVDSCLNKDHPDSDDRAETGLSISVQSETGVEPLDMYESNKDYRLSHLPPEHSVV
jgi:hypothetical protein